MLGKIVKLPNKKTYTEFRSLYTKLEGVHREKEFYYSKYGVYCNLWRKLHKDK